jgi:sugar-specific transcriptional regulator TrmB
LLLLRRQRGELELEFKEESLQLMSSLGLSVLEAKVYLALAKLGKASAKTISKASRVSQPDVYRVLSKLENHGLVEREVAIPNQFKATTMDEGLALLLQRRDNQSAILHKKATELIQDFKEKEKTALQEETPKFVLVPGVHVHRIRNAVDSAQKIVLCFTSLDMFRKVRFITEDVWKRCVKRGIKFQFIIGNPHDEKVILKLDPVLKNNDYFEIKWTRTAMPCMVLIDGKEVFLRTEMNLEAPVLWSNNPVIVAMIQEHFETKWKTLKEKYEEK